MLSLFTSAECAEAIAGDLAEERRDRGEVWFWRHVLGTVVALSRRAVAAAPLRTLALLAAGCAQFGTPAFAGVAVVSLFPPLFNSAIGWMVLSLCWWGGALWTGAFLVTIAPTRGMAMCVVLALLGEVLMVAVGAIEAWQQTLSARSAVFYAIPLLAPAPLLAGGAIARWRGLTRGGPVPEPQG